MSRFLGRKPTKYIIREGNGQVGNWGKELGKWGEGIGQLGIRYWEIGTVIIGPRRRRNGSYAGLIHWHNVHPAKRRYDWPIP